MRIMAFTTQSADIRQILGTHTFPRQGGHSCGVTVIHRLAKAVKAGRIGIWWRNPDRIARSIGVSIGE